MNHIEAARLYTLQEIVDEQLIPNVNGYAKMYSMVTIEIPDPINKRITRKPATVTTTTTIKPSNVKSPWNKISSKITVEGFEILKFLKIHSIS